VLTPDDVGDVAFHAVALDQRDGDDRRAESRGIDGYRHVHEDGLHRAAARSEGTARVSTAGPAIAAAAPRPARNVRPNVSFTVFLPSVGLLVLTGDAGLSSERADDTVSMPFPYG
jgi:hypothetical protein